MWRITYVFTAYIIQGLCQNDSIYLDIKIGVQGPLSADFYYTFNHKQDLKLLLRMNELLYSVYIQYLCARADMEENTVKEEERPTAKHVKEMRMTEDRDGEKEEQLIPLAARR